MLVEGKRPRELHWYHAGPMLFGDWGTSRLYVLGLAFYYARHASIWFMAAMCVLLIAVAWAYQIICRSFPDGGGVYSSARHRSPTLAVIGGLLLCADYLVTAAISALDGFHYLNVPHPQLWALASIALIGVINYFGPKKAGTLALVIALLTVALTLVVAMFSLPSLEHAQIDRPVGSPLNWWTQFTALILAISGVEAVANMTGIMVEPVDRTARWSIWPVLIEIVILNLVLTVAMLAIPTEVLGGGNPENAYTLHRDDMLRALADYYVGPAFAAGAAIVFALLLLSAANTAITDLVSIQFMMSRDRELPSAFGLLNSWGMPVLPLVLAFGCPMIVLLVVSDVEQLADLYAIGVVGAIAINLGTCSTNPSISLKSHERLGMGALALLMVVIWITIAIEKPHALIFAMSVMGVGLSARFLVRHRAEVQQWMLGEISRPRWIPWFPATTVPAAAPAATVGSPAVPVLKETAATTGLQIKRIMVASGGSLPLFRFALEEARSRGAELFVLFVRHLAVPLMGTPQVADAEVDRGAQEFFKTILEEAKVAGVPVQCLYTVAWNVGETILQQAVRCDADLLILGATRRGRMRRVMKGNVVDAVASRLPRRIRLLIRA